MIRSNLNTRQAAVMIRRYSRYLYLADLERRDCVAVGYDIGARAREEDIRRYRSAVEELAVFAAAKKQPAWGKIEARAREILATYLASIE